MGGTAGLNFHLVRNLRTSSYDSPQVSKRLINTSYRRRMRLGCFVAALIAATIPIFPAMALIDATLDDARRYEAVVVMVAGVSRRCTATKIAPLRFLTAAHCVANTSQGRVDKTFAPGSKIRVSNVLAPAGPADFVWLHVEQAHLPPEFVQALEALHAYQEKLISQFRQKYSGAELERRVRHVESQNHFTSRIPDLAIVEVREQTAKIPMARIDFEPLAADEPVRLVGYGCEGFDKRKPNAGAARLSRLSRLGRRNWGETRVIRIDPVNFYTFAHRMRPGAPSLCPGDSGGPVMRAGRVVGVHGTVYGLARKHGARSNMSVNLQTVQPWLDAHRGRTTSAVTNK
jgi:hypothetical protein